MAGKIIEPKVHIPPIIEQGDSVSWADFPFNDIEGTGYSAANYSLVYTIAGVAAAADFTAAAQGTGWLTSLTTAQSGALGVGKNWWQAQLKAAGVQITVARGELTVVADISGAAANYSGASPSEQSLAAWQACLNALAGTSGPAVESYRIGEREMRYRNMPEILSAIAYWNAKVINERTASSISQNQGNPRKFYARFRSRFGTGS